jgi:hypothetical protein
MKLIVEMTIGFGAGLVFAGLIAIFTPLSDVARNTGLIGLGAGLFLGGILSAVILRRQPGPERKDRP